MAIILFVLLALFPIVACGEDLIMSEQALRELSKDLAGLYVEVEQGYSQQLKDSSIGEQQIPAVGQAIKASKDGVQIRAGADKKATTLSTLKKGESLKVVGQARDWYAVSLEQPVGGLPSGWVSASDAVIAPYNGGKMESTRKRSKKESDESLEESLFKKLTDSVAALKTKYQNNSALFVEGFSVVVSVPPSVTVQFKFK